MFLYLVPSLLIWLVFENDLSIIKYLAPAIIYVFISFSPCSSFGNDQPFTTVPSMVMYYELYKTRVSRGLVLAAINPLYLSFFNKKTLSLLNISI